MTSLSTARSSPMKACAGGASVRSRRRMTIMSMQGQPDLKEQLLKGHKVGNASYKVHLDGYDQTDLVTGKGPIRRKEFYYFTETALHGLRYGDFKFLFKSQDKRTKSFELNIDEMMRQLNAPAAEK